MTRILILFLILLTLSFKSYGREEMKSLTINEGLAGESVYKIFKSRWNVIWIGTSNGITSYDGYNVKTYKVGEQRSQNKINDIAQSSDGFIWAATPWGLYKVDGSKKWLVRALPEIQGNVSAIKIINDRIYCSTEEGLFIASTKKGEKYLKHIWPNKNHVKGNNNINDIIVDDNMVWILCNYELYSYNMKTEKVACKNIRGRIRLNNPLRKIAKYKDRIFIGTFNDGLFVYNNKENTITPYLDVNCRVITCMATEGDRLYVGTDGAGLHVISLKDDRITLTYTKEDNSPLPLKDNTVYAYYHDPTGVNFFGYFRQGLQHNYFRHEVFHEYNIPGLFSSYGKNIRSFCIDGKRKVLGSRGGLWYVDEEKNICKFFAPDELGGSIVTNVVKYAGMYYCCTFNGGVMRLDPKTLTTSRFGTSEALRTSSFGCLKVSPHNELWMAGNTGVYIYNATTNTERHFDYRNSQLPDAYCNNIIFDRQDRCWISTANGLCLYDPIDKTIHDNGFPKGFFNTQRETTGMVGDADNLLFWSLDGLFSTNEEMTQFKVFTDDTPAAKEYISQIIYDKRHRNYWIATETGMFRYDNRIREFKKFADETGLMTREFSNNAITITDGNTLWTGTMDGLFYCNLDEIQHIDQGKANIILGNILIDGEPANDKSIAQMVRQNTVRLTYHWGSQTCSFTPVILNYCNQKQMCFEYRFGTDGEWKQLNGLGEIMVKGLPLGQTIMQIRLAGSKHISTYHFYVFPSPWFILEFVSIVLFCILLALFYRQRKLVKTQQEEMARVQRELEEAKRKYSRVNTNEGEQQRLLRRLEEYMRSDKPFINNDLKLSDVASYLDVSTVKLSQLFSMFVQKNYYDYINQWRLEEFKLRLNDKRYANFTLLALAEECGFKRSSFFSTFKKVEGMTPTEYAKKVRGDK